MELYKKSTFTGRGRMCNGVKMLIFVDTIRLSFSVPNFNGGTLSRTIKI